MHCGESGLQTRWDSEVAFDRLRAGAATAGEPATRRRSPRSTSCRWLPAHRFQRNPGDASGTRGGGESSSPLTRLVPLQGVPCLELCWIQWRAVGRRTQGAEAGLPISQPGEVCPERQTCFIGLPLETIAHDFGDLDGSQVSRKLALATSAEARGSDCARWVGHPPGSRNDRLISAPAGRYRALLLATPIHLAGRSGDAALFAAKMAASSTCPRPAGFQAPSGEEDSLRPLHRCAEDFRSGQLNQRRIVRAEDRYHRVVRTDGHYAFVFLPSTDGRRDRRARWIGRGRPARRAPDGSSPQRLRQ